MTDVQNAMLLRGNGIGSFFSKVNNKLKEGKYISRALLTAADYIPKYSSQLSIAGNIAKSHGYGPKKKRRSRK